MDTTGTPDGYQRVTWVPCGHSADAPVDHDWSHRHWCPVDEPDQVDEKQPCPGIRYLNPAHNPPVERPARCGLCGRPGVLYPAGVRCLTHSPAMVWVIDDSDGLG